MRALIPTDREGTQEYLEAKDLLPSQALLEGAAVVDAQIKRFYFNLEGECKACALGAMVIGYIGKEALLQLDLKAQHIDTFPALLRQASLGILNSYAVHPIDGNNNWVSNVIADLNDSGWTFSQIAHWLAEVEKDFAETAKEQKNEC